ncbi:uncharacterized protein NPIL_218552 [Nephila pilipes]|uniref:Uncharacterized protein n=1 Tax=Nephila pilipes TaxID=299642 RepID=A0A8X6JIQ1_NEPPI|nr:uncharacterized protein NPIL_218551 [Nephila pilipes]GFS34190.1 uncharacterized protein NPIL_218552 [Nephila pilipes]
MILKVFMISFVLINFGKAENTRNTHPNHRNSLMSINDLNDRWIGMPKSPYVQYTASVTSTTASVPPPTSVPVSTKRTIKQISKKKRKPTRSSKRRSDEPLFNVGGNYRNNEDYPDFEFDYDTYKPSYKKHKPSTPYVIGNAETTSKVLYMNPSASSPSASAIYAGVPKVATYVVPSSKKYIVERVKSHAMYIPPVIASSNTQMYASPSRTGVRRLDPLDYDDNDGSFLGPRDSFPPRAVMNKITEPGQRQPCHGPECHQHHKGLVRFYWRRVVYPTREGGRNRPASFRRPQRFRNRRRFRDRARAPSDQKELYTSEPNDDDDEDTEDMHNHEDDEEYDEDENDNSTNLHKTWKPGNGYGHDLHEGSSYNDENKKVYRDKRYAYKKKMKKFMSI